MTAALAGDFDYDSHGRGYSVQRRTDPRIAALVQTAPHAELLAAGASRVVIIDDGRVEHVFHPIAAPAMHAQEVMRWLSQRVRTTR